MPQEVNVLALYKGNEKFIYVFDDASQDLLIDTIRHQAADPKTSVSWFDAAILTERARQQVAQRSEAKQDQTRF